MHKRAACGKEAIGGMKKITEEMSLDALDEWGYLKRIIN